MSEVVKCFPVDIQDPEELWVSETDYEQLRAGLAALNAKLDASKFCANVADDLRAELDAIKAQEPVAWKVSNPLTGDELLCSYKPSGAMYTYQPLYAAPVAKQVVIPDREWLRSEGLIYSLENDVNYYEINVTQVEGSRHDGQRAEFASKLIELLNAADHAEGGQDE